MRIGSCVCRKPSFWLFLGLVIICIFRKNRDDVVMVLDGEGGTSSLHIVKRRERHLWVRVYVLSCLEPSYAFGDTH